MKRKHYRRMSFTVLCIVLLLSFGVIASRWTISLKSETIRAAAALTTSFVASTVYQIDAGNQLEINGWFTVGSSSGCHIKIEFSENKTTWVQESYTTIINGIVTHTPFVRRILTTGDVKMSIPVLSTWYRVSVKAMTSGTNTSLTLVAVQGNV